jgi:hypothetical protein
MSLKLTSARPQGGSKQNSLFCFEPPQLVYSHSLPRWCVAQRWAYDLFSSNC